MLIFHVDMNSFFASCEQSERPDLIGKPIIVCGDPNNRSGIVLAASYEAKKFGVKTTMLISEARKLCPSAIFLPSRHKYYSEVSKKVMRILDEFTPLKEQASIDEAYLDMTGTERLFKTPYDAAVLIQETIKNRARIGCSIGISTNKLLAKMGSDMKKPMGITALFPEDVEEKMWPLSIGELFGVGKKTTERLEKFGIHTIGDLAKTDKDILIKQFGPAMGEYLFNSSNGIGEDHLIRAEDTEYKSIGNENTFAYDLKDINEISSAFLYLSETVGYRLRKQKKKCRTITIKIKYYDFSQIQKGKSIPYLLDSTDRIFEIAFSLFKESWNGKAIRLLGVSLSGFDDLEQESLFNSSCNELKMNNNNVDKSIDALREKYGFNSIKRASLILNEKDKNEG